MSPLRDGCGQLTPIATIRVHSCVFAVSLFAPIRSVEALGTGATATIMAAARSSHHHYSCPFVSIRGWLIRVYSRLLLVENDFSFFDIGMNPIARNELSFQQRETQWVKQSALNHTLKRPCTVYRVVALFGQYSFGCFAKGQLEILLFQPLQYARQLNIDDPGQLFFRQPIEDDYLVYSVQEFGPEMVAKGFHDSPISFRTFARVNNKLATDIAGHDDDRVFEVDGSALPIRDSSIV